MKKVIFVIFALFTMHLAYAQQIGGELEQEVFEEELLQANAENGITAYISGETSVVLSGGSAQ